MHGLLDGRSNSALYCLPSLVKAALNYIERLGHTLVDMCRNNRIRLHNEMQHYRAERLVGVAERQCDATFTVEWEAICLNLTVKHFLIDHDTLLTSKRAAVLASVNERAVDFIVRKRNIVAYQR